MIQVNTRYFGPLECPDESVVTFPSGIPPFYEHKTFVVISKEGSPVTFLQSTATPELCFITAPIQAVDPAYRVKVEPLDLETLQVEPSGIGGLTCLAILTVPEQGPTTANLAAPVLINPARNIAVQAIRSDRDYSHAHPLEQVGG